MGYNTIILEKIGKIGKLSFNRPEVLNAYNWVLSEELANAIRVLSEDEAVHVIVITGAGKAFMAGADIGMVNEWSRKEDVQKIRQSLEEMFNPNMLEDCPKPIIALVNGLAFGMGCEIAIACDFRIASEKAKFALPEIKLGIIPGGGGSQRMLRLVRETHALEMIVTGDPIDAKEAYRIGLVNRVVPADKLWDAAEDFAARLADKSRDAVRICKDLIYRGGNLPLRPGVEYERERFCEILMTDNAREGTLAFIEKREPQFK